MLQQPQFREDGFPCQALYHHDEENGSTYLMFERELTQTERSKVRESVGRNSHWTDTSTLWLAPNPETD